MKIKDSVEQITLDLFQNCDVPEEVSGTFDQVDLNDGTVGRSRYERLYSVRTVIYARENMSSKTFARAQSSGVPLKELSRVKLRRKNSRTRFKEYPEVFKNS